MSYSRLCNTHRKWITHGWDSNSQTLKCVPAFVDLPNLANMNIFKAKFRQSECLRRSLRRQESRLSVLKSGAKFQTAPLPKIGADLASAAMKSIFEMR